MNTFDSQQAMAAALAEVRQSAELQRLIEVLSAAHAPGQDNGAWNTPVGRQVENALGHLQVALEAAGGAR